jgi:hypothetical protein
LHGNVFSGCPDIDGGEEGLIHSSTIWQIPQNTTGMFVQRIWTSASPSH